MKQECCGTCKYNKRDWTNENNPDYYCGNENSDYYAYNTEYKDKCEEWEERTDLDGYADSMIKAHKELFGNG